MLAKLMLATRAPRSAAYESPLAMALNNPHPDESVTRTGISFAFQATPATPAALFPIALSFAVAPGWTLPLLTIALFVTLELFSNNVPEPWLYGSSTGLSPVAILVAAVFWTALWGPVGLLLSTPLTVCLVVLGRHVPQLGFFHVLLGDEPALSPELKFYQRLLARDAEEATELAEEYLEDEALDRLAQRSRSGQRVLKVE